VAILAMDLGPCGVVNSSRWDGDMLIRFGVVALLAINLISAGPTLAAGDLRTALA
jgi:hypothetical protein